MKTVIIYTQRYNANYDELFLSFMREGRRRGWRFAWLAPRDGDDEPERMARMFDVLKPAGFVGGYIKASPIQVPKGMPQVWLDSGRAPQGAPLVRHDNASIGEAAADALADGGGHFAAFGLDWHVWSTARTRTFAARVRRNGGRCRVFRFDRGVLYNPYLAFEPLCAALRKLRRPVSVFAVTDRLAAVTLMAAESLGWHCPRDIRIVGVDDDPLVCMSSPVTLSSVHPDWTLGGRLVAEVLETQMRGKTARREYVYGAAGVTRRASTRGAYRRPKDKRVERALAFIAAEFASPIGIPDVVEAMGCSRSLAELRFREETGKTILKAIEDMRWERLLVLLRRRDADLSALPTLCGFRSAAALRAFFRRRTGMSMTEWRKAMV